MSEAVVAQPELPLAQIVQRRFELPADSPDVSRETSTPVVETKETPAAPAPKAEQDTGDKAPPATPEAKQEELTPEAESKRSQRRIDRKIDKAYRQRAEAQAKADLLEKKLAELEKSQASQVSKPVEGEPRLEQFDYDPEKYAQAKAEFAKTQTQKEIEAKQRTEAQQKAHQALVSSWEDKADKGAEKYDDWETIVGTIQPTVPFIAALMEADNGHDIAYHLGKNPTEARRIASLPPMAQVREIGKLEAKLLSEPEKPKAPSKAPAPITPLTGAATIATAAPSEDDDTETWIRKRQKQVHGKR